MLRALETIEAEAVDRAKVIDSVTLDLEARRKRRQTLTAAGGTRFLVDLAVMPCLRHGDGLLLEDGGIVKVDAALEALIEVLVTDRYDLPRIAWHLGNRHLPVQFVGNTIRLRADHVIEAMLAKLGAEIRPVEAPFDPEGGAYGHGHTHGHD
jgi:urease accessory protein